MTTITADGTVEIRQVAGDFQYNINNGGWSSPFSWPVTLETSTLGGSLKVIFTTDLILDNPNCYFICNSANIQIGSEELEADGTRPIITIDGVVDYPGLVKNGESIMNGNNNISIYNLDMRVINGGAMLSGTGWIGQSYFCLGALNNQIVNCSSDGPIVDGGGIIGNSSARYGGNLTIRACYSSGVISNNGGGIAGQNCASNLSSVLFLERCSSNGDIGNGCGGIVGISSGTSGGNLSAINCYSTGSIDINGGGIFGLNCGVAGIAIAENCYSRGNIQGGGGGIFGQGAGAGFEGDPGSATATNCFSTGNIALGAGGIFGDSFGESLNDGSAYANNCYTSGSGSDGGIWAGSNSDSLQGSNNYGEANHSSSGWNDARAKLRLTDTPTSTPYGVTWSQPNGINTPYFLSNSGYSPYSLILGNTYSESVAQGESSNTGKVPGYTYSILQINGDLPSAYPTITINTSTGSLSASASTPLGVYTIYVFSTKNPYSITEYDLTLTEGGGGGGGDEGNTGTQVCCKPPFQNINNISYNTNNLSGETQTNLRKGKVLITDYTTNSRAKFPSYSDYYRYLQTLTFKK